MSILTRNFGLEARPAPYKRPDDPYSSVAIMETREEPGPPQGFQRSYRTRLLFQSLFYANDAEYEFAMKLQERELLQVIYGPVFAKLHRMRTAINNRDWREAMDVVDALEKEILE